MRLIDADALLERMREDPLFPLVERYGVSGVIDAEPTAEPKTGRWMIRETAYEDTEAKCSECGFVTLVNEPGNGLHMLSDLRFCPNCGAKMEGVEDGSD